MSLRKALDKLKTDIRMIQINEKNGSVTKKDREAQLSKLEDLKDKAVQINFDS